MRGLGDGRFALGTGSMSVATVVTAAVEAEAAGAEAIFVGDNQAEPDALVTSALVATATQRVRVGPGVVSAYDRHPASLARAAATLDRLTPGRVHLGIGRGDEAAARRFGLDTRGGLDALEDTLRIARPLLDGAGVEHRGRRWSATVGALSPRTRPLGRVPLYLAAVGERTLRLAGRLADGVLLNYAAPVEYVRWAVATVEEAARAAGRNPGTIDVFGWVLVARTDTDGAAVALERVGALVAFMLALPGQGSALAAPAGGVPARLDQAALARFAAIGDLAQVHARLDEYREAGLRCPVLLPSGLRALTGARRLAGP